MNPPVAEVEDFVALYRQAFQRFGGIALWNVKQHENPDREDVMAITRSLRIEGNLDARRLAERIERACRATH